MTSLVQANVTFQGSITSLGTFGQTTYAPVDLGVNSLSLATGNLTSLITTTASAPTGFAAASEGALVFPGTANAYISFGTTGQPFSNSNIYAFGDFVVEAWVNPANFTAGQYFINGGDPNTGSYWFLATNSSTGTLAWFSFLNGISASLNSTAALTAGTWQHVTVIHQSASKRLQLYLNGQPQAITASGTGFSVSGTVGSYTTGIVPVVTNLVVGQNGANYNGSLTNLRVTTGSGAAQIYNNNAFTPSTSPLFPASNTVGGSLTTRLLVRVPLAPGKMVVPKLGGANCNTVLAFPPAPMTGYATNMTGKSYYGQGVYVASASSEYTDPGFVLRPWLAFDKSSGTVWASIASTYNSSGVYIYTTRTVDVNGNSYSGEWLQIQKPSSIVLSSYSILNITDSTKGPATWSVLGSSDGINWFLIDQRSGVAYSTSLLSYSVASSQAFSYFRIVISNITGTGTLVQFAEWTLNGTIEGPSVSADGRLGLGVSNPTRALEVAGDVVCGGTVSSGNPFTFKNALYNGDMRINQRGISTNWASPTAAGATTGGIFGCDRWNIYRGSFQTGAVVAQLSLAATDAPYLGGLQFYQRVGRTSGNSGTNLLVCDYNLESRDSYRFVGQHATFSFWYRTGEGLSGNFLSSFTGGTGIDQPSRSGLTGFSSLANRFLPASNYWQKASITGFVNNSLTQVAVSFSYIPSGLAGGSDYFDVTGVQLEKGTIATPFESRPYATELALCQRYYETSYGPQTTPGTANQYQNFAVVKAIATNIVRGQVPFRNSKRGNFNDALSSGAIYSYAGTLNRISNMGTGLTDVVLTTPTLNFFTSGWISIIDSATPFTVGETYIAGWAASAEL
jgi:hypothetical protein